MPGTIHAISECVKILASSPGPTQILSPRLRDKIWVGPGDEAIKIHSAQLNVLQAFNASLVETS